MGKKYYCTLSPDKYKLCKHGGNRSYGYGFLSGTAGFCNFCNAWTSDLEKCPLILLKTVEDVMRSVRDA